jgi:membrane protein DedA with SNARE-associated domain
MVIVLLMRDVVVAVARSPKWSESIFVSVISAVAVIGGLWWRWKWQRRRNSVVGIEMRMRMRRMMI